MRLLLDDTSDQSEASRLLKEADLMRCENPEAAAEKAMEAGEILYGIAVRHRAETRQ